ncbi:MAG: hypothetical protein HY337_04355 [Gemmatimonadetes bacterium]|nr:hypothetical protein [Gemmatimonadota bacterium]
MCGRRFEVAAAILCAATLACESPSDVPELWSPVSAAVVAPGADIYSYTHQGDVLTDPGTATGKRNVGAKSDEIWMSGVGDATKLIFEDAFADPLDPEGKCFPRTFDGARTLPVDFSGALRPDKRDPSTVGAQYWFRALGTDGLTPFKYLLSVEGTVRSGEVLSPFPPAPGQTSVVDWTAAAMSTEGKGKGTQGGNAGAACTGPAAISGSVTVVGVS